jgi:hypothetical protein
MIPKKKNGAPREDGTVIQNRRAKDGRFARGNQDPRPIAEILPEAIREMFQGNSNRKASH